MSRVAITMRYRGKAELVYVRLTSRERSGSMVVRMDRRAPELWAITLNLVPGEYLYRYYLVDGETVTYSRPDDGGEVPVAMRGLDAVLRVEPVRIMSSPSNADSHTRLTEQRP